MTTLAAGDRPTADEWNDLQPKWAQKLNGPQSVTSSTTLVDVTQLVLTPGVSKKFQLRGVIYYTAGSTGDIKLAWTFPAGATLYATGAGYGAAGNLVAFETWMAAASGTSKRFEGATAASIILSGTFEMGVTAGSLQLQFAQDTSNATSTQILNGSEFSLLRVA